MKLIVEKSARLHGTVNAPPSKSHTQRAIIVASLASGKSIIANPLRSDDCTATIDACRKLGARIIAGKKIEIAGVGGLPSTPGSKIDAGNSGTTIRFLTAVSALCDGKTELTGDASIQARPIGPLLLSLTDLGAKRAVSLRKNGCPPLSITGKMTGGRTIIDAHSSQYVSALLVTCPLAARNSEIVAHNINSRPYIRMTLEHLERAGATVHHRKTEKFQIDGRQEYQPVHYTVPGDYSSAAFLMAAAHITGSDIQISGLDDNDSQGDRAITDIINRMRSGNRRKIDLRDIPDLLPVAAVLGCHAGGSTVLANARHARQKESDRISAVCAELKKMGAIIEERPDGLRVESSNLKAAKVDGHGDHRIVMALAVAAMNAEGKSFISDADTLSVSYPRFVDDLAHLGANIRTVET